MLNLRDFIEQTLRQISDGVSAAQASSVDTVFNPQFVLPVLEGPKAGLFWCGDRYGQLVHFDVALTATEGTGTKGGIGVFAGVVSLGSAGESKAENATVSRVKFFVPIALPLSPPKEPAG